MKNQTTKAKPLTRRVLLKAASATVMAAPFALTAETLAGKFDPFETVKLGEEIDDFATRVRKVSRA